ncbi:putative nuclease HARBI1 [Amphibalanus amphitrite]|uniref:putative nuclease HARBI1 n=1 Tax=Amphibalanus amphitrite TaxID=1232801 RepID=UPI001C929CC1|nr:putative nuclease HARBI1 [Amphibalanus amphitrite]
MKFTWVNVGWPGSVHDARIYRNELEPLLMGAGANHLLGLDGHLLGDAAFPLSPRMLVPFRDNGHLNDRKVHYNNKLSSTRMTIERTFGRFKGKFRRMKMLDMLRVDLIPNVILAACVLHNVSMGEEEQEEAYNPVECPEEEPQEEEEEVLVDRDGDRVEAPVEPRDAQDGNGALKRDAMVERLWAYRRGRRE